MTVSAVQSVASVAHADYKARVHFGSLDGLRFLSIAMVLWHHWTGKPAFNDVLIATRGFTGVDFFFVISGFLITTLLLREEARKGSISISGFYQRRARRILPAYLVLVTLVGLYYLLKHEGQASELLLYYYLFVNNFLSSDIPLLAPTWSLAVEQQYYLVWPLVLILLPRRFLLPGIGLFVGFSTMWNSGLLLDHAKLPSITLGALTLRLPPYAPILIGAGLATMLDDRRGFALLWQLCHSQWAAPAAFVLLVVELFLLPENLRGVPELVMHLTMALCLATVVIREDHALHSVLMFSPVARIGEISYGVYLYHLIGHHIANVAFNKAGLAINTWPHLLAYVVAAILLAEVSYRTVEAYFLRRNGKASSRGGRETLPAE